MFLLFTGIQSFNLSDSEVSLDYVLLIYIPCSNTYNIKLNFVICYRELLILHSPPLQLNFNPMHAQLPLDSIFPNAINFPINLVKRL